MAPPLLVQNEKNGKVNQLYMWRTKYSFTVNLKNSFIPKTDKVLTLAHWLFYKAPMN